MRGSTRWFVALSALCALSVGQASTPAVADEPSAALQSFGAAVSGQHDDTAALIAAIQGWIAKAKPEDVRAIVIASKADVAQGWPPILLTLLSAGAKTATDASAMLALARDLSARVPEALTDGHWQAALALLSVRNGDLDAARAAALKARELGVLPCGERCDATYLAWLDNGEVPAEPAMAATAVYDPRGHDCASNTDSEQWMLQEMLSIDPALLVRTAHGPQAELAWRLAHYWESALSACPDSGLWTLREAIDDATPALVVEQSWREAQSSLAGGVPAKVRFLGVDLPLPLRECDFAADATCQGEGQPLGAQSALTLVQQLRAVSRYLDAPGRCPAPPSDTQKVAQDALRTSFASEIKSIGEQPAAAAVIATLQDPRWQPLLSDGIDYRLRAGLLSAAIGPAASQVYQAFDGWAKAAPLQTSELTSTQELLGRLALRAGQSDTALSHLTRAQASDPSIDRAKTIGLLRAAIAGADLSERASTQTPKRPWTYGLDNMDLLQNWYRASLLTGQGDIGPGEIALGLQGPEAALALDLAAAWPALLWGAEPIAPRVSAVLNEVYGSERLAQLRAEALASISLEGEPSMRFAGVRYPLPDRFCDEESCENPQPTTRERIIEGLAKSGVLTMPRKDSEAPAHPTAPSERP